MMHLIIVIIIIDDIHSMKMSLTVKTTNWEILSFEDDLVRLYIYAFVVVRFTLCDYWDC